MTAVAERPGLVVLEQAAQYRALWLSKLFLACKSSEPTAGTVRGSDLEHLGPGADVVVLARGAYRRGLVLESNPAEVVVEYLTANALAAARALERAGQMRAPAGVSAEAYAAGLGEAARREAERKLVLWRTWSTTSPNEFATDEQARRVWRHIEPGHHAGSSGSVAPAAAAMLARQDAIENLRRYPRVAWPRFEYSQAFGDAYVRDRVSRLCQQAPYLAWVKTQRVTVPRRFACAFDVGTGE